MNCDLISIPDWILTNKAIYDTRRSSCIFFLSISHRYRWYARSAAPKSRNHAIHLMWCGRHINCASFELIAFVRWPLNALSFYPTCCCNYLIDLSIRLLSFSLNYFGAESTFLGFPRLPSLYLDFKTVFDPRLHMDFQWDSKNSELMNNDISQEITVFNMVRISMVKFFKVERSHAHSMTIGIKEDLC